MKGNNYCANIHQHTTIKSELIRNQLNTQVRQATHCVDNQIRCLLSKRIIERRKRLMNNQQLTQREVHRQIRGLEHVDCTAYVNHDACEDVRLRMLEAFAQNVLITCRKALRRASNIET